MGKMVALQSIPLISQWQLRTINKMIGSKSWQKRKQKKKFNWFLVTKYVLKWMIFLLPRVYIWINECVSHILTFSLTPLSFYIHIIITSCKIEMIWIGNNIQSNRRFSGNTVLKTSILKARTLRYGRKTSNTIHMYGKAVFFCMNVCASECEWRNAIVKWLPLLYDEWFGI